MFQTLHLVSNLFSLLKAPKTRIPHLLSGPKGSCFTTSAANSFSSLQYRIFHEFDV